MYFGDGDGALFIDFTAGKMLLFSKSSTFTLCIFVYVHFLSSDWVHVLFLFFSLTAFFCIGYFGKRKKVKRPKIVLKTTRA